MHEYVQKSINTTLPRSPSRVKGGELIHSVAPASAGSAPSIAIVRAAGGSRTAAVRTTPESSTRTNGAAYLTEMMPGVDGAGYMAYINAFPIWVSSAWAIGVWAGLAGTILLLMRHRWAVPTLLLSFIGAVIGIGYQILKPSGIAEMERGFNAYVGYLVIAIALALFLYARAMRTMNVLA